MNTLETDIEIGADSSVKLLHEVLGIKPRAKSWRQTVGMIPDDELSRSAGKLGRIWREQANKDWFATLRLARVPSAVRYTAYE